jgi:hypothetical protein
MVLARFTKVVCRYQAGIRSSGSVRLIGSSFEARRIVPMRMSIRKIQFVIILSETVEVWYDCYALCQQYSHTSRSQKIRPNGVETR